MTDTNRRSALKQMAGSVFAPAILPGGAGTSPNEKFVIGAIGTGGRGRAVLDRFAALPGVEVAAVCDVDARNVAKGLEVAARHQQRRPAAAGDFRRVLDDKSIDVVLVTTPDHWHAIPTILACQAGKHVYVEKPASHNVLEGQAMVRAARRYNRVVQVGVPSRSSRHLAEACEFIRSGGIGQVRLARGWDVAWQGSIGHPADSPVPDGVDYDFWLGPAPLRPFNKTRFHSSWRWFFDYGTGDLGNDGVHRLDYARRGLEAGLAFSGKRLPEWPLSVNAVGGKHFFDDDQEWPDNMVVTWEYPEAILMYELRTWSRPSFEGRGEGAAIYGENGTVFIFNETWQAVAADGQVVRAGSQRLTEYDSQHNQNLLNCIRDGKTPAGDIALGHVMSSLVLMGNVSWRVNRRLKIDAASQSFTGDADANRYLGRTYRQPWSLPSV